MPVFFLLLLLNSRVNHFKQSTKLYLSTDFFASFDKPFGLTENQLESVDCNGKLDFKTNFVAGGSCGTGSNTNPTSTSGQNICNNSLSPSIDGGPLTQQQQQQFNIFPAIFSRQLNFSAASATQTKLMDELRPNLVGGLLGLQQGLLEDHALAAHGNLQHSGHQDSKFMSSLQDNRLMGITSHENRLLGLSHDLRSAASINNLDNSKNSSVAASHQSRKCSSTPEDFSVLYGGLSASGLGDTSHHHTPAHTPPSRHDHSITGKYYGQ